MAITLPYPSLVFVPLDKLTAEEMNQIVANYTALAGAFPIPSDQIADLSITSGKIAANAVTSGKIASGAVGSTQLASSSVGDNKINWGNFPSGIKRTLTGSHTVSSNQRYTMVSATIVTTGVYFIHGCGNVQGLSADTTYPRFYLWVNDTDLAYSALSLTGTSDQKSYAVGALANLIAGDTISLGCRGAGSYGLFEGQHLDAFYLGKAGISSS